MYYNPGFGVPTSPCTPSPCQMYQAPVMPMNPYGVQPVQSAPQQMMPMASPSCGCSQMPTYPASPMPYAAPCYNQMPQAMPISVEATIMPQAAKDDCDCQSTKKTYTKTTYMEAEVPLMQSVRKPYQTTQSTNTTCTNLPLAQSYVQPQTYKNFNDVNNVLTQGTYFKDLYKPYTKGGNQ